MESTENIPIGEDTRSVFRSSASWMGTYAVTLLVVMSICFLVFLILLVNKDYLFTYLGMGSPDPRASEMINGFLLMGIILVSLFGYSLVKLLISGNKFHSVSAAAKREDVVEGFKNLRSYWMISGIAMIVLFVVALFVGIRMASVL